MGQRRLDGVKGGRQVKRESTTLVGQAIQDEKTGRVGTNVLV